MRLDRCVESSIHHQRKKWKQLTVHRWWVDIFEYEIRVEGTRREVVRSVILIFFRSNRNGIDDIRTNFMRHLVIVGGIIKNTITVLSILVLASVQYFIAVAVDDYFSSPSSPSSPSFMNASMDNWRKWNFIRKDWFDSIYNFNSMPPY